MNICIVTVPSSTAYGFDGVSEAEFDLYQRNVTAILNMTTLGYDEEFAPRTNCARHVWSDSDEWTSGWDGLEMAANPINESDEIVNLSEEFYELQTKYDFFIEMSSETTESIAQEFQAIINKYDDAAASV